MPLKERFCKAETLMSQNFYIPPPYCVILTHLSAKIGRMGNFNPLINSDILQHLFTPDFTYSEEKISVPLFLLIPYNIKSYHSTKNIL
jgi:hypothetical protein